MTCPTRRPRSPDIRSPDGRPADDPMEGAGSCCPARADANRVGCRLAFGRALHEIIGGYCHQSRNLLNTLNISLYLAQPCESSGDTAVLGRVEPLYKEVEQFFDRLQAVCRPLPHEPVKRSRSACSFRAAKRPGRTTPLAVRGRRLRCGSWLRSEQAVGAFDPTRLQIAFDDLVAWGAPRSVLPATVL